MPQVPKRTVKRDNHFFKALENGKTITDAAEIAGYPRRQVYAFQKRDADFEERWKEAKQTWIESMEREADRRAVEGFEKPVFYQGKQCGSVREFSDVLLMFRMKGEAPDKYRERRELTGKDGGPIEVNQTVASERLNKMLDNIASTS